MGDQPPSVYSRLEDVYNNVSVAKERLEEIRNHFLKKYDEEPTFYCRAPGRVNIIGEHIDYCGYGVLPMALEQDIIIACSLSNDGKYRMSTTVDGMQDKEVDLKDIEIKGHDWHDYYLCGHKAILAQGIDCLQGMKTLVDGTVPKSAGLSSSSALVCCSALVSMTANNESFSRLVLGEACQKSEKYVGIEGGGMDQAISYLAEKGTAKFVEFNPLRAVDVRLPNGVSFVIANSLREMTKSEDPGKYYNKRVSECRIAAQILSKKFGKEWRKTRRLVDTQNVLEKTLPEMVELVEMLNKTPYTREEICKELEITDDELITECLNPTTAQAQEFKLYNRAKHVYSEANRVLRYKEVCASDVENKTKVLGDLMNESQESCSKDYECSCAELDELTEICRNAGALGSRLTGAGWGGCTVSLVPTEKVDEFISKVKTQYYDPQPTRRERVKEALFATEPGSGAAVLKNVEF
ncbi:N-acetylgalactosamine kinase-like [Clytia hemisphaerica]|uniref:N-acetylgalactosamine kinase n=1 Tax=Clytia hemisphaerica TaxID=252671 RepID=A0A7M5XK32_9CNID|eukprot:TCONS_00023690-protein